MVISADKPEDEFFIAVVDEERDIKVGTAVHCIVKIIKTQDRSVLAGFFIFMKLNHITGDTSVANLRFAFTGFSRAGHKNTYRKQGC